MECQLNTKWLDVDMQIRLEMGPIREETLKVTVLIALVISVVHHILLFQLCGCAPGSNYQKTGLERWTNS